MIRSFSLPMEAVLPGRPFLSRLCPQKCSSSNYFTIARVFLSRPSCVVLRTAVSKNEPGLHLRSRCLGGGNSDLGWNSLVWNQRRCGLACRANPDDIPPDPYVVRLSAYLGSEEPVMDISQDKPGMVKERPAARVVKAIGEFAAANFLLVALVSSVLFGLAWPAPGRVAQQKGLTKWCTCGIFLFSGLNLRSGDADKAIAAWPAGLFGLVSILLITPIAALPILSIQISPRELVAGLAIFACVPTTLSSAVSLTQVAGANIALALGMTVLSNLISIVTMPFTLTTFIAGGIGVSIPRAPLLRSLVQTLLLPLLLGKVLREAFSGLAKIVDGNKRQVSMITTCILGLVPWMQISSSKEKLLQIQPSNLLMVAAAGLALHVVYLATNSALMKICPSPSLHNDYNSRAVLLVSSQKSIIVAIAAIGGLGEAFGNAGLLVLPCIAGQLAQIIIDSILVNKWLRHDARTQVREVPA